ncbi:MAG: glycosyltransferase family 9 protein [Cyclobacteriaceae bacterium]|nr:glycosyltransferase family 9 protein [Cyclobacteriaceae bacterium]
MEDSPKILVKLPNKLGDTIMASSFLDAVKNYYPESQLDVIMAKGITDLKFFMPEIDHVYEFSKNEYSGLKGNYKFGRMIARNDQYDLFFCLPFSFSSAISGFFSSSKIKIGYNTEGRGFLFNKAYKLPPNLHVVEDYIGLLEQFLGKKIQFSPPQLVIKKPIEYPLPGGEYVVLNVRSGPPSRFIPISKAVEIIVALKEKYPFEIVLTGATFEKDYINEIEDQVKADYPVINLAGKTSIIELGWVLKNAKAMITTDSGNGHFANALGTKTVVLFGAGLQSRCHPYNKKIFRPLQLLEMECVPCRSELCKYNDNRCLANIENDLILKSMEELLKEGD